MGLTAWQIMHGPIGNQRLWGETMSRPTPTGSTRSTWFGATKKPGKGQEPDVFWLNLVSDLYAQTFARAEAPLPVASNAVTGVNGPDGSVDPAAHEAYLRAFGALPDALKPTGRPADPAFDLPDQAAIVVVIDVGIPLCHRRTRLGPDGTRILAAWQQGAARLDLNPNRPRQPGEQMYLPFGRELLAPEINALLRENTAGGRLDEDGFNRDAWLEDYRNPEGQRELGKRAAHGAHVLDLATGLDPEDRAHAEALRIIAVNLPARRLIGHSARFLEFFAVLGMIRIVQLSDAVWQLNAKASAKRDKQGGYPTIINLSFGMQASARDGSDLIASALRRINAFRAVQGQPPVHLSIPAGNENLEMGNARATVQPGAEVHLDWRVLPEDQSANFVEIWSDIPKAAGAADQMPFTLKLAAPNARACTAAKARVGQIRTLLTTEGAPVARLYCDEVGGRMRYVIATRPTQHFQTAPVAPAGVWTLSLRNRSKQALDLALNVQTDQTEQPISAINQRSYFERADYKRFDETGRAIDSYGYPDDTGSTDSTGLLRRHGTINAIGMSDQTATVAGHRISDGRPGPTSGTGLAQKDAARPQTARPTASMPMRRGAAHHGVLSAGSRDGSAIALEGTSFSAAQMTKQLALTALDGGPEQPGNLIKQISQLAAQTEDAASHPGPIRQVKSGDGRMDRPAEASDLGRFHTLDRR